MRPLLLLAIAACAAAVDLAFAHEVAISRAGESIRIVNARDRQEVHIVAANVVAVLPADRDDNSAYTTILCGANTVRIQSRLNPADAVVAALAELGFGFVPAVSDRDTREPDTYLVNMSRVDLIERTRTDAERSDTVIHFTGGAPPHLGRIAINQSAGAYGEFLARARR